MSNNKRIWLSSPHMGGHELKFIKEAFDTNWVAPLGPNVDNFEFDLANYLGEDRHVAALSSGTSAIHLALILAGVEQGDYVICQSLTFSASANPVIYQGGIPVFIDSEEETWNMSPQLMEEAIISCMKKKKKPKAIIVVHLYGMPAKMDEILKIAAYYEIPVIEDAAEALGSSLKNQRCGTFSEFGILSFNGNKIITTSGGGALICRNSELASRARFLSTQARDNAPYYQHSTIGYNYRMSNILAGIGRGQMIVLDERIEKRRQNNRFYRDSFRNINGIVFQSEPDEHYYSNFWLTAILIDPQEYGMTNEQLRLAMEKKNIESRRLWKPMHLQPVFKEAPFFGNDIAEKLFETGLCIPSGSNLGQDDLTAVTDCFR